MRDFGEARPCGTVPRLTTAPPLVARTSAGRVVANNEEPPFRSEPRAMAVLASGAPWRSCRASVTAVVTARSAEAQLARRPGATNSPTRMTMTMTTTMVVMTMMVPMMLMTMAMTPIPFRRARRARARRRQRRHRGAGAIGGSLT